MTEPREQVDERREEHRRTVNPGAALAGIVFIVLGVLFLLDAIDVAPIQRDLVWPIVVIALGVAVIFSALWRGERE